jgi:hypothetical protein
MEKQSPQLDPQSVLEQVFGCKQPHMAVARGDWSFQGFESPYLQVLANKYLHKSGE